jgi:hypothetical protein
MKYIPLVLLLVLIGCATKPKGPPLPPHVSAPIFSPLGVRKLGFEPCQRLMGEFTYAKGITNLVKLYELQSTTNFIDWVTVQSPFTNSCIVTTNHDYEFFRVKLTLL